MSATTPNPADVLVIFGITGDLARKMTFRALYRLEAAGRLDSSVDPSVAEGIDDTFLAVPREVPSNVARHVHATRTSILVHVNGHVVLRVTDGGTGTSNITPPSGPRNLRQRAEALGRTMKMTDVPTGGTLGNTKRECPRQ
ncbi:MAG: hypothetical protein M0Z91_04610 [Actinomycetota bacterium]|jgi:signal transduction histidine kinase|nr:hypothetical protein [Actinomycetota bacterium]